MRKRTIKEAKDTYGNVINVGDAIVFSWGGSLRKAFVERIKLGMRASLTVIPTDYEGNPFRKTVGRFCATETITATVKNSISTVKI